MQFLGLSKSGEIGLRIKNHNPGIAMKHYQHISDEERLYIRHGLRAGRTQKQIAEELAKPPSTISRIQALSAIFQIFIATTLFRPSVQNFYKLGRCLTVKASALDSMSVGLQYFSLRLLQIFHQHFV